MFVKNLGGMKSVEDPSCVVPVALTHSFEAVRQVDGHWCIEYLEDQAHC